MNYEPGRWYDNPKTGVCPLPPSTRHLVQFENGNTQSDNAPEYWSWSINQSQGTIERFMVLPNFDRTDEMRDRIAEDRYQERLSEERAKGMW